MDNQENSRHMKLFEYQQKYIDSLPTDCIMAAGLGTGKTVMSLAHWETQRTGNKLLIVAPASKIRTGDWQDEAERWFMPRLGFVPDIESISYESLRIMDTKTRRPRHWQFTAKRNGGMVYDIIADECHALKNPQSKQSKAILEIKQSGGMFIGLSGTPMPNGWLDFAGYSKLFGYTKGITEFKKTFCVYQDFKGFPELVRYMNEDILQAQMRQIMFKLDRSQANELPDRQMIPVNIKMTPKSLKKYITIKTTRVNPDTKELLDQSGRLLSVMRQSTTDSRLDSLLSVVNDTSDNVVVFYNYISEREAILKALKKTEKQILRYDGEIHDDLPKAGESVSNVVLVAHYKSASTGLNLQWANVTVYFSPTYSYQEFAQSLGRTHRTGQTKKCLFYFFNVRSTIDSKIWDCLKGKRSFNDQIWEEA